jgi:hypothetical protein
MDLGALCRKGIPGQHHIVFPTIKPADARVWSLVNAQALCIALSPRGPLGKCWLEFAMPAKNLTIATDEEQRAIDSALGRPISFDYPNHYI